MITNKQTKELDKLTNNKILMPKMYSFDEVKDLLKQSRKDAIDEILKIIDNLPLFLFSDFQRQKLKDKIAKEMQE